MVARDPVDLLELTAKPDFTEKLYGMLDSLERVNDPLWLISCGLSDPVLKKAGITRTEKTTVSNVSSYFTTQGLLACS